MEFAPGWKHPGTPPKRVLGRYLSDKTLREQYTVGGRLLPERYKQSACSALALGSPKST